MNKLKIAITIDLDWASDAVLEYALKPIIKRLIPLTIFVTHNSDWLHYNTSNNPLIELEIHPNFCLNSSHGATFADVIKYCDSFNTEKIGFRCHKYYDVNEINEHYVAAGYKYTSNICTNLEYVKPFYNRVGLLSIPIFMEDGGFLLLNNHLSIETIVNKMPLSGTLVFLFHPMHLAFNSSNFNTMKHLKASLTVEEYQNLLLPAIEMKRNSTYGINTLFWELIEWSKKNNVELVLLKSLVNE